MAMNYDDVCSRRFPANIYDFDSRRQSVEGGRGRQMYRPHDDPWTRRQRRSQGSESRSRQRGSSRPGSRPVTSCTDRSRFVKSDHHGDRYFHRNGSSRSESVSSSHHGDHSVGREGSSGPRSDRSDRHGDGCFHRNGSRSESVSSSHHGDHSEGSYGSRSDRSDRHGDGCFHRNGSRSESVSSSHHGDHSRRRKRLPSCSRSDKSDRHGDGYFHRNGSRSEIVSSSHQGDHSRGRKRRRSGSRSVERPRNGRAVNQHRQREESGTVILYGDQETVTPLLHFPELWSFSSLEADELQMALWESEERIEDRACDGPARKRLCVSGITSQPTSIYVNPNHLAFTYLGKYL